VAHNCLSWGRNKLSSVDSPWFALTAVLVLVLAVFEHCLHRLRNVIPWSLAVSLSLLVVSLSLLIVGLSLLILVHCHVKVLEHAVHGLLEILLEPGWVAARISSTLWVLGLGTTVCSAALATEWLGFSMIFPGMVALTTVRAVVMSWTSMRTLMVRTAMVWAVRWMWMTSEGRTSSIDVSISLGLRMLMLINDSKNGRRSLAWVIDFQEGVRVVSPLFAVAAIVEVLANAALEPWSNDWGDTAAIALNVHVLDLSIVGSAGNLSIFWQFLVLADLFTVVKLLENLSLLFLKLFLDDLLEDFSWHTVLTFHHFVSGSTGHLLLLVLLFGLVVLLVRIRAHTLVF